MNLLFVCSGNTCRSPMAAAYFNFLCRQNGITEVRARSAGTSADEGRPASPGACSVMNALGLSLRNHSSARISAEIIDDAEAVYVMTAAHLKSLQKEFKSQAGKFKLLMSLTPVAEDVADPYGGDADDYNNCFLSMIPALAELADRILRSRGA